MLNTPKKIFYLAEFSLPSSSAYSIHVLKMCDRLSELTRELTLIVPFINSKYKNSEIKKDYNLKNNFKIIKIFNFNKSINFIYRIIFSLSILKLILKERDSLVISRSILSSLILSIFQIQNYLELHHDLKGFTKFFFKITNFNYIGRNINYIFLHKNIYKIFNCHHSNFLILDDAVEIKDFNNFLNINLKKKNNFVCSYFGSLTKGKGLELIEIISKKLKNIEFHIYSDESQYYRSLYKDRKNLIFKEYIKYNSIPKIMSRYDVVLMPYMFKVFVKSSNLETSKYMSPLKLFDYMASAKIIIASDLKVYRHILKNNFNCILINPLKINLWCKKIIDIKNNYFNYRYLKYNAYRTVQEFTWEKRAFKILKHYTDLKKKQ